MVVIPARYIYILSFLAHHSTVHGFGLLFHLVMESL